MKSSLFLTSALFAYALTFVDASHQPSFHRRHHNKRSLVSAAAKMNKADAGPSYSSFEASSSLPSAQLAKLALKGNKKGPKYQITQGSKTWSTIYEDWAGFKTGAAYYFTADMDIDCDGIDDECKGNTDGQRQTDFGALAAYAVPWMVIPESFAYNSANKKLLSGNNVAAVICGDKMFYGIFGDSNGDSPEVIGEASWLMGRACFGDGINGGNGHAPADVTYIVFTGESAVLPKSAMSTNYITEFSTLKSMGDKLVGELAANLKLSTGQSDVSTGNNNTTSSASPKPGKPIASSTLSSTVPAETSASCLKGKRSRVARR